MADKPVGSSSDLERAREISRQLRGGKATGQVGAGGASVGGFSASRARAFGEPRGPEPVPAEALRPAPADATRPAPPRSTPLPQSELPPPIRRMTPVSVPIMTTVPPPAEDAPWEVILEWCRQSLSAEAAFVIDVRGLLVANSGALTDDDAQAMGARLVAALAQADELEHGTPVRILVIDLSQRRLTGLRLQAASGGLLTLGLVSARPLASGAAALLKKAFARKLAEG
ncbi:MAG: hypothetical protein U0229_06770 [Anaeromyxobacter sp.]